MGNWELVYETDGAGSVISGDITRLARAVSRGGDIKVMYNTDGDNWWSRYCPSVNIRGRGRSARVAATYMEAADTNQIPEGTGFDTPFAIEYQIYNSGGHRSVVKLDPATGNQLEVSSGLVRIRWYARDYFLSTWEILVGSVFGGPVGPAG